MDITNKITGETILSVDSLNYANLIYADLRNADLRNADLSCANLMGADLMGADLNYANLRNANLMGVDLMGVNLSNTNLWNTTGNGLEIKTIQTETYHINYTTNIIQIGCENNTIKDWFNFSDKQIIEIGGKKALVWWRKWKPILKEIIK